MRVSLFLAFFISIFFRIAYAEEFNATVIYVMDGDTVLLLHNGKKIKARLANIDAPESSQVYGKESRQALIDRVLKQQVYVSSQAVDVYGRIIAELSVDGKSVNEDQLEKGMAWEYSHYHANKHYVELERQARQSRLGLWGTVDQAIAPEQWRKSHLDSEKVSKSPASMPANSACGKKHLCSQMKNCEEARVYYLVCGVKSLDGDGNGVPCESLCQFKHF